MVVPDVSEFTIEDATKYLADNYPNVFQYLINQVNASGTPSAKIDINYIKEHIPEGNHNLTTLTGMFSSDLTKALLDALKKFGVNLNQNNILISTAPLKRGRRERASVYEKGGKSIALLTSTRESAEAYMKMRLAQAYLEQLPKDTKSEIEGTFQVLLEDLKNTGVYRIEGIVKSINSSRNKTATFVQYLFGSASFNRALRKIGKESEVKSLFNDVLNVGNTEGTTASDPVVQTFIDSIDNGRISVEKLKEIGSELGTSTPIETIQEINNRIDSGRYFDIKFMGDQTVIFNQTRTKPQFEFPVVNQEYYGEQVTPVMSINGYNIVEHDNKYYVSSKIIQTVEDLPDNSFLSLNAAMGAAKAYVSKSSLSMNNARNMAKVSSSFKTMSKLKSGDRFIVTDVKLDRLPELTSMDKVLGSMSFDNFFKEMKKSPWKQVFEQLSEYNIQSILTTPEKVETFIWLRAKYRETPELQEEYKKAYTNQSPRTDTPEKIALETKLTKMVLDEIMSAKEVMFEVVNRNGNAVEVDRLQLETEVPVYRMTTKSFKGELVEIAGYLARNFGVEYNIVTTSDIKSKFGDIIPNAYKVNAFVYEGQVYINVDNATTADALHEFAHLIMGTIKQRNPDMYYALVNSIENAANYALHLGRYRNDKRSRIDLNEEIFVEKFSEYLSDTIVDPWLKEHSNEMAGIEAEYQNAIKKVLQVNDDVKLSTPAELNGLSVQEIMGRFGSALLERDEDMFDINIAKSSREAANLISQLKNDGLLTEDCK